MTRLEEIRKREAKATKGPWEVREFENLKGWIERTIYQPGPSDFKDQDNEHDFIFIAHAREDIPWLISEVERLKGLIKEAEYAPGQYVQEGGRCPWCLAGNLKRDGSRWPDEHPDDCPAFTPDGQVK